MMNDSVLARVALVTNRRAAAKRIEQRPARPGQRTATEAATEASTLAQLMALKRMSVNEMKAKWEALFATPAPNNSRGYLELRIGWRIQELTHGGPSRETRRTLDLLADEVEGKTARRTILSDSRNPVIGTRLLREWDALPLADRFGRDPDPARQFGARTCGFDGCGQCRALLCGDVHSPD